MNAVGGANPLIFKQALQLLFDFCNGLRIKQLAQIGVA